jgi:uncharacterized protein YbjT (DUF2867 family)
MKLLIFGATGATGRHLVRSALEQGHQVTAFVRDPGRLGLTHPALGCVVGDVMIAPSVEASLPGHDAVLCALGVFPEGRENAARCQRGVPVCSVGTRHILAAMASSGCRRIVVETAAGVGSSRQAGRFGTGLLGRALLRDIMADKELQETAIRGSGLDWTIIRPPRLTNGPATGKLEAGEHLPWSLLSRASRADVADFMLGVLEDRATVHKALTVRA